MTATLTDSPKATPKVASTQLLSVDAAPPQRALLRYFGGKWRIAPWVIEHFPPHRIYVEPFGGAASVLLRKPRSAVEVYNDLDDEIVHLMRTVQRPASCQQLMRLLRRTPYARREFERAFEASTCPITRAQRTIVRAFQSFHHEAVFNPKKTTFADARHRSAGRSKAHEWAAYPHALAAIRRRLQGVIVENRDALQVLRVQDTSDTLFFVDPPYLPSTRSKSGYRCELSGEQHIELLRVLRGLKGMVVLAGYPSDLYDEMLGHWHRVQRPARAAGSTRVRTEVLWINPAAIKARESAALKPPMG